MAKVWLITGGERGLGRYIAEAALASGEHVLATASRSERLADLQALYGTRLCVLPQAADDLAARGLAQAALEAFGRVDVLVNTAGPGRMAPFEQIEDGDFRAEMDEHFFGLVNLTRAVLPIMRQQRSGHIINVSSVGGRFGAPGLAAYQARNGRSAALPKRWRARSPPSASSCAASSPATWRATCPAVSRKVPGCRSTAPRWRRGINSSSTWRATKRATRRAWRRSCCVWPITARRPPSAAGQRRPAAGRAGRRGAHGGRTALARGDAGDRPQFPSALARPAPPLGVARGLRRLR